MHRILLLALFALTSSSVTTGTSVPVMIGEHGEGQLDACTSVGAVSGLNPKGDRFLAVRLGPGTRYRLVDKLTEGQRVFLCSVSKDGQWHGVVYSRGDDTDCGVTSPVESARPYTGHCQSGWVNARWIKVVAG